MSGSTPNGPLQEPTCPRLGAVGGRVCDQERLIVDLLLGLLLGLQMELATEMPKVARPVSF